MTEEQIRYMEDRAYRKWGSRHPVDWKRPPRQMPRWFDLWGVFALRELEGVFGHLEQSDLDRFWSERSKGQHPYEDAGGYMIRCYSALMGE